jgi:hypothetical protein
MLVFLQGLTYKVQKKLLLESKELLAQLGICLDGSDGKKDT